MSKIKFTFINNEKTLFDELVDCQFEDKNYNFKFKDSSFKLDLGENFVHLIKKSNEDIFELKGRGNRASATYVLGEYNKKFDIKVLNFEYKKKGKKYIIKYVLESEPESVKTLIIEK